MKNKFDPKGVRWQFPLETVVQLYPATRHHIPKEHNRSVYFYENLKSQITLLSFWLLIKVLVMLQEEQTSLIEQHQQRLAAQQKEHLEELQQLRTLHHRDLEEAQKQHSDMLEHLKRAHALESDALKEASSYKKYDIYSLISLLFLNSWIFFRVVHVVSNTFPPYPSMAAPLISVSVPALIICAFLPLHGVCTLFLVCMLLTVIVFDYLKILLSLSHNVQYVLAECLALQPAMNLDFLVVVLLQLSPDL